MNDMLPEFELSCSLFARYGLDLERDQYDKFDKYADFLVEYNKNVNLTAITESNEILIKHFLDSVMILKFVDIPQNSSIIDVGTGAGFPSIPLKIMHPDIQITLLDSLNKRIVFLQQLCEILEIDAEFIHGRAENYSKLSEYREKFDFSCARAVADLGLLSELCIPFVKVGGSFLSMKGPTENIENGKNAVSILGGEISAVHQYLLENDERRIVEVRKISQTPTKYPRNSAQIQKKPL